MPITGIYGPDDFANRPKGQITAPRPAPARTGSALPMPSLAWTPEVERATAHLYERVKHVIPPIEWPLMAPTIKAINELKTARDAVILAHNYQAPEIFHCVADIGGDLAPARGRGHQGEGRHHRAMRRALHGGDLEAAQPGQDRC